MATGHYAYFEKDGKIRKEPLIKWARFRRMGWAFSTEKAYLEQEHGDAPAATVEDDDTVELPTMENTKAEIIAFAAEHGVTVNVEDTKAQLIEDLDDALG